MSPCEPLDVGSGHESPVQMIFSTFTSFTLGGCDSYSYLQLFPSYLQHVVRHTFMLRRLFQYLNSLEPFKFWMARIYALLRFRHLDGEVLA